MANKTVPNAIPVGAEQLAVVDDVIGQIENVSRTTMDRQTANNRVGRRTLAKYRMRHWKLRERMK
jgi:hypothetical protein